MIPKSEKSQLVWTIVILVLLGLSMTVFAGFIGYGKGGFNTEIIFKQFTVYGWVGIGALFIIFLLYLTEIILTKGDSEYGDTLMFNSPGEKIPGLDKFLKNKYFKGFLLVTIVGIILGLFAVFNQQTYLGVGTLEQQFTYIDGILYNIFLVVPSENLIAFALGSFLVFTLRRIAIKYKWGKQNFILIAILVMILSFIMVGFINHQLRYQASEQALQQVIMFWAVMGVATAFFGFLAGYSLHAINNIYVSLTDNFSNEALIVPTIIITILLTIVYFYFYVWRTRKRR